MNARTTKTHVRTRTFDYDIAAQLHSAQDRAAYLDAWLAEAPDDVAGIVRALGDVARSEGMAQVARDAGLGRESLYKSLRDSGNPSFATVVRVVRALGMRLRVEVAE